MISFMILVFIIGVVLRGISFRISSVHECAILDQGGREYGRRNTKILATLHILIYAAAFVESFFELPLYPVVSGIGIVLYVFGMIMLFAVIKQLGSLWTVKLYIAKDHKIIKTWLFKNVKHPNYYLNLLPEIVGYILIFNAWRTMAVLLPLYLISLGLRIYQEEKIMHAELKDY
ncbi:MAG: hypothetical protein GY750_09020 [Lentisphaerae bacterium]|nr:hypothetical protein [Lentisphaerota bacterium]MCP4101552.1 hypothetical protein [Lentisphaerota bacterium]